MLEDKLKTMWERFKYWIIGSAIVLTGAGFGADVILPEQSITLTNPQMVVWNKPTTDAQWAEDTEAEGLNYRFDFQLQQMKSNLEEKLFKVQKPLYDKAILYPDAIGWEYVQQGIVEPELTKQVNERIAQYIFEYEKMAQSIERINKEIELRADRKVDRSDDILLAKPSTKEESEELKKLKESKGIK